MNIITPVDNTNNIRMADFVRLTTAGQTYLFTTAPSNMSIPSVSAQEFSSVGTLMSIGDVQRDIKSTANETTVSLTGIDTAMLGFVLA